jgi:uncharacterized protein
MKICNLEGRKMSKSLAIIVTWILLIGCSSPAKKTYFYTLNTPLNESMLINSSDETQLIVIQDIQLADYLRQQGIIVKQSENRLQVSNNHRWAESLDAAIAASLRASLENNMPGSKEKRVELASRYLIAKPTLKVQIEITQFEIDNMRQRSVHTGRYWIRNANDQLLAQRRFNFSQTLSLNGFEHAVSKLQQSVHQLSRLLAEDLQSSLPKLKK